MYFRADQDDYLIIECHTTRYLGAQSVTKQFLTLLSDLTTEGLFLVDTWGTDETCGRGIDAQAVVNEWTRERLSKYLYFSGDKGVPILFEVGIKPASRSQLNTVVIWIYDSILQYGNGLDQLVSLMLRIDAIAELEFGFVSSRKEHRRHSFPGKLTQRLPGVYWATLFGSAYVDLFGLEKLLSAPCDRILRLTRSKVLLIARPHPVDLSGVLRPSASTS